MGASGGHRAAVHGVDGARGVVEDHLGQHVLPAWHPISFSVAQQVPALKSIPSLGTVRCPRFQAGAKSQGQPSLYSVHTSTPLIESSFIVIFQNFHHQKKNWEKKKKKKKKK